MKEFNVSFKVSSEEKEIIEGWANTAGMSVSAYVRQVCINPNVCLRESADRYCAALCLLEENLDMLGVIDNYDVRRGLNTLWLYLRR